MEKIRWLEWGHKAFEKAKKENKPILMDIFGKWCHWCHVMDEQNYENAEVIKKLNQGFVCIRVDTDRRPDINERYNQGGWPTTAFLDYEGNVIWGATYIPPEQFLPLLDQVTFSFGKGERPRTYEELKRTKGQIGEEIPFSFLETAKAHYDMSYGGFGEEPKFPMIEVLEFLLQMYGKEGIQDYLQMVEKSLQGMIAGIFDAVDGGFFRYSVTRDWHLPHYEKMLETNGGLVGVFSKAYLITKKDMYVAPLKKTVSYLLRTLSSPKGGFYASQDADGEEKYYGKYVDQRKNMPRPTVDKTIFSDLNGKALLGLLEFYKIEKDKKVKKFIETTLDLFWRKYWSKEQGFAHYVDRKPVFLGLLRDNLWLALAFSQASAVFGKKKYLERAREISAFILKNFWDKKEGGFFDSLGNGEGKLTRKLKKIDENSVAARVFLKLGKREIARGALELFANDYQANGIMAGEYSIAVKEFLEALAERGA